MIYEALFWWSTNKVPRSWEMLSIKVCQKVQQAKKKSGKQQQKAFLLLWQKSKWQNISICKCENFLSFANVIFFSIWGANSIETNLQTCNLPIGQSISYKSFRLKAVSIEFAPSNGKNVSHLQIHTFCHFNFFNNRRNGFSAVGASRRETRQESEEA